MIERITDAELRAMTRDQLRNGLTWFERNVLFRGSSRVLLKHQCADDPIFVVAPGRFRVVLDPEYGTPVPDADVRRHALFAISLWNFQIFTANTFGSDRFIFTEGNLLGVEGPDDQGPWRVTAYTADSRRIAIEICPLHLSPLRDIVSVTQVLRYMMKEHCWGNLRKAHAGAAKIIDRVPGATSTA